MIETCAGFSLLTQPVSVSGGDEDSALRLRSGRHIKSAQSMTNFDSIISQGDISKVFNS